MTLIFVYNADSGLFNRVSDMAHKLLSPSTYACRLCALTHGHLGMHDTWRDFLDTLDVPLEFLHKDEFQRAHGHAHIALPAIVRRENGDVAEWLSAAEINACDSLEALIGRIEARLGDARAGTGRPGHPDSP